MRIVCFTLFCIWTEILFLPVFAKGSTGTNIPAGHFPPQDFQVTRYQWDEKDGLPNWNITCSLQDSRGLMWMVSNNGLFTFDGHRFRSIQSVNTLPAPGDIHRMAEDLHGQIWLVRLHNHIATVDVLDPATEKVRPLHDYLSQKNPVRIPIYDDALLTYDIGGRIWIGSLQKGYRYDGSWNEVLARSIPATEHWYPASGGQFWFQQGNDLYLGDGYSTRYERFANQGFTLRWAWLDSNLRLWAAYSKPGQTAIDHYYGLTPQGRSIAAHYTRKTPETGWINEQNINAQRMRPIRHGLMIAQKADGIYLGRPDSPWMINLSRQYPDIEDMQTFYLDRSGGMWSSNTNGLIRIVLSSPLPFKTLFTDAIPAYSMRGIVRKNDILYALSYGGARQVYLSDGKVATWEFPGNRYGCTVINHQGVLWIGQHGDSLYAIHADGKREGYFIKNVEGVFALHSSPSMGLIAGTKKGVYRLRPGTKTFERMALQGYEIFAFHESPEGLWVGSSNGLYLLNARFYPVRHTLHIEKGFNGIPKHIYEDPDGRFWIATHGSGLIHWDPATDTLHAYNTRTGMSNDNVHAVYPDKYGYLWLPSDRGLMRFHKATGYVETFYKMDGLASDEFNALSHFQDADGTLFLGGINGISYFHPKDIPVYTESKHPLSLIEAHTFRIETGRSFFQLKNASALKTLVFKPRDTYLDLEVSPFLYVPHTSLLYEWKIDGFHTHWMAQNSSIIRIYDLPYGTHTLYIRYRKSGDTRPNKPLALRILVVRPFYLRWPFLALVALLLASAVRYYNFVRLRQLRSANLHLESEVLRRTREIEADKQTIFRQASELRTLDELKSKFFANVTHELRTPLTLILGPTEHLIKNAPAQNTQLHLNAIQRNAQKLLNLVDELLDLSKMESNKLVLEEKPVHVYKLISHLFASFTPYAEHRKISFNLHFECAYDLTVMIDARKFEKIISNLLSNALKFNTNGGKIDLLIQKRSDDLLAQVSDSGQGIRSEDLPFIFDRYFQSKTSEVNVPGGTGIGLSLCREYAHLFGGTLSVQSEWGRGSIFTLVFPLKYPPHPTHLENYADPAPQSPSPPYKPAQHPERYTVLVVEDDLDMVSYIQSLLANEYNLLVADNGKTALQYLDQSPVDLVLSDVMMPEIDGFALLETVKKEKPGIPFIFLTALMSTPDRIRALRTGVDDYLTKPFLEDELRARLQNLLQRYKVRQDMAALDHTGNAGDPGSPSYDQKWMSELEAVVYEHISNPDFSIVQLASRMNLSIRALQYKIKSYTGLTAVNYLTEMRLVRARVLLETHRYETISEVCYAVGFKTKHYFARLIKERYGKLPSEF